MIVHSFVMRFCGCEFAWKMWCETYALDARRSAPHYPTDRARTECQQKPAHYPMPPKYSVYHILSSFSIEIIDVEGS